LAFVEAVESGEPAPSSTKPGQPAADSTPPARTPGPDSTAEEHRKKFSKKY